MTNIATGHLLSGDRNAVKDNKMKESTATTETAVATAERKFEMIAKKKINHVTGHTFTSYAVKTKEVNEQGKNVWMDVRFSKEIAVSEIPTSHAYIFVDEDKCRVDTRNKYPKLWINKINRVEHIERPIEDLDQYFE